MEVEKLVRMANQIAAFYAPQGEQKAAAGVAKHLQDFWDPRMRSQILAHLDAGGDGLNPSVREGLRLLRGEPVAASAPASPKKPFLKRLLGRRDQL
jgi:formate dehydrogenase subunit delta